MRDKLNAQDNFSVYKNMSELKSLLNIVLAERFLSRIRVVW